MKNFNLMVLILKTSIAFSLMLLATACNNDGSNLGANDGSGTGGGISSPITAGGVAATPTPAPTATPTPTPVATVYSSCKQILAANPSSASGYYTVNLGSTGTTTSVYCDMTTDGGGWMVVFDGLTITRDLAARFFDNTDATNIPDSGIISDPSKGVFWEETQYLTAKNMPDNTEFHLTFSANYTDPTFGTNCYAILGVTSPSGYSSTDSTSFTAFIQKNDDSAYIKSQLNDQSGSVYQGSATNEEVPYPYPFKNGSRIISGNPYGAGYGNTCTTFFLKTIMIR